MSELLTQGSLIDKKLAEEPIVLPESPFWEVFKDFGRDEVLALIINLAGTAVLSFVSKDPILLAIVGPALEKIGFFVNSSHEALQIYKTTTAEERKSKLHYLSEAIKNGTPNLLKDIIFHDPLYTGLMLLSLEALPETPVWLLSIAAFLLSLGAVTSGEVAVKEALYHRHLNYFEKKGLSLEKHLEARFAIKGISPDQLIRELANYFNLGEIHTSHYHDQYYPTNLRAFNGRRPIVRVRQRTEVGSNNEVSSTNLQIVYTKARRVDNGEVDQYNYYPVRKDKLQFPVLDELPQWSQKIIQTDQAHHIQFSRTYANIPGEILISVDLIDAHKPYTVVEIKSFRDNKDAVETMIKAMRHVMSQYDVIQTTHSKRVLTDLKES